MFTLVRRLALTCLIGCIAASPAWAASGPGLQVVGAVSNNSTLSGALSVAVAGQDAFTTSYWPGRLTAVDISHPASPTVVGSTPPTASLQNGTNVAVAGGYAFVVSKNRNASPSNNDDGTGNSLTVVNISNPASPVVVGSVRDPNKLFGSYGIALSGSYAYVAYQGVLAGQPTSPDTSMGGFSVIDISNPAGPTIVANIDNSSLSGAFVNGLDHSTSVAISGHYAYVTAFYSSRLTVVNIANPTNPQIVASLHDTANMAYPVDVAVQGQYAYVADQVGGSSPQLTVVDISTPPSPRVVGTLSSSATLNNAYRIRVRGRFAYLAAKGANAISAIDVANPAQPRLAAAVQDAGHLYSTVGLDLDASGRYVIANSPELSTENGFGILSPPFTSTTGTISVIALIPSPIGAGPSISGAALVGHTLTAAPGSWSGIPTISFAYQWQRCAANGARCAPIAAAQAATYRVSKADIGHAVVVSVRATNGFGSAAAGSRATRAVPPAATASLNGVAAGKPRVRVVVDAGPRGAVITQVTLTLPSGLRGRGAGALAHAITVRDAHGHRVALASASGGGSLAIHLRKRQKQVTITVTSGGLQESPALRRKARHHRGTRVALGVAVKDRSGHVTRQTLRPGLF